MAKLCQGKDGTWGATSGTWKIAFFKNFA